MSDGGDSYDLRFVKKASQLSANFLFDFSAKRWVTLLRLFQFKEKLFHIS